MGYHFRTLNYLGSKLRLLDFIEENIRRITNDKQGVCDLFAGSGCVSYKLSEHYAVTSCDIQNYSTVISNALLKKFDITNNDINELIQIIQSEKTLHDCFIPLIETEEQAIRFKDLETLTEILETGSIEVFRLENKKTCLNHRLHEVLDNLGENDYLNKKSLISRYYGGIYFSYRQAVVIDIILEAIQNHIVEDKRDFFLAALLSTASDVVDTVGKHFAQPIKARDAKGNIKITVYNKALQDKTIDIIELYKDWIYRYKSLPKSDYVCQTIQGDYIKCLRNLPDSVKTIYADPPYTRDHYSRFYHVLETITLRDSPELTTTNIRGEKHISNGIYRKDRHQSPFCIMSKAHDAFKEMFEITSSGDKNLVLSYSPYDETKKTHPRVVTLRQLLDLAKVYYQHVDLISAGKFRHNKLNSTEHFLDASSEAEVLIVCTNE